MTKEIKTPLIVGLILYGAALIISMLCVLFQSAVFDFMNDHAVDLCLDRPVFPLITIFQIFEMLMYAVFTLVMFKYKGSSRKHISIILTVVYCILNTAYPFVFAAVRYFSALFQGSTELAASTTLESAVTFCTAPFITVSTVLMFIAIGRFGITKRENNEISQ